MAGDGRWPQRWINDALAAQPAESLGSARITGSSGGEAVVAREYGRPGRPGAHASRRRRAVVNMLEHLEPARV